MLVEHGIARMSEYTPDVDELRDQLKFHEAILANRFNFQIVFFGLVIAGASQLRYEKWSLVAICFIGAVFCFCLWRTILRSQDKVDVILEALFSDSAQDNVAKWTNMKSNEKSESARKLIPFMAHLCWIILLLLGTAAMFFQNDVLESTRAKAIPGMDGRDGAFDKDGVPGRDGRDGRDGLDGINFEPGEK